MGEVYRARDTRLDRSVAIKVLPAALASDVQLRDRFEREARAISSLSHPHICALFDVGHQDGVDFLVLEYLEGETLAERLATRQPTGQPEVRRYERWKAISHQRADSVPRGAPHRRAQLDGHDP